MFWKIKLRETFGGEGSGNHGHLGRPGEVGGSGEGGGITKQSVAETKSLVLSMKKSQGTKQLSDKQIKSLSPFNIDKPVELYRGVRLDYYAPSELQNAMPGDMVTIDTSKMASLSDSRTVSEGFMVRSDGLHLNDKGLSSYGIRDGVKALTLQRTFSPSETIVDIGKWMDKADEHGVSLNDFPMFGSEGEVVAKPGNYQFRVVTRLDETGLHRK